MKEIVVSVVNSAVRVIQQTTGLPLSRPKEEIQSIAGDITIAVNLEGNVCGRVMLVMPRQTAELVSAKMLGQPEVSDFSDLHQSCLAELGNMIAGNAATDLAHKGLSCRVSPPSMYIGQAPVAPREGQVVTVSLSIQDERPVIIQIDLHA